VHQGFFTRQPASIRKPYGDLAVTGGDRRKLKNFQAADLRPASWKLLVTAKGGGRLTTGRKKNECFRFVKHRY